MRSSLRERAGNWASVQGSSRVKSGTAVALNLRPDRVNLGPVTTIAAIEALVKRQLPVLRAKRAIEAMLDAGHVVVGVPKVESVAALIDELRAAGVAARSSIAHPSLSDRPLDVAALRQRLDMTQEQFAAVYQIELSVLRNWEQGRNQPDHVAQVMLRLIESHPRKVEQLLWSA